MSTLALQTEQEAQTLQNQELSLEAQVFLSFKHRTPHRYKLLDKLVRANITPKEELTDKTIYLGEKAKKLLRAILKKLFSNRYVLINHKYITQATRCKSDQNTIILRELERILKIQFYRLYTNDKGTKFSRHYYIELHPAITQELKDTGTLNSEFCPDFYRPTYINRNIFNEDIRSNVHAHESNFLRGFSLASFYPLSQPEAAKLQALCGRGFSGNAINEILLSMSKRLTDRFFKSKKAFMNYMAKALAYEKRDAVKISNRAFRIRANMSNDEIIKQQKEAFLTKIEGNTDTTLAAQLSRKLASILSPDLAYDFLLAAKFPAHAEENSFGISLQKSIDLSEMQYRLILEQVQSVYGSFISSLEFIVQNQKILTSGLSPAAFSVGNKESEMLSGVWGRIRTGLIKTCGEGIDHNWFSKLKVNVDEERGEIKLYAPTLFIRDWIQQNYQHLLEKFCNKENYRLMEVCI